MQHHSKEGAMPYCGPTWHGVTGTLHSVQHHYVAGWASSNLETASNKYSETYNLEDDFVSFSITCSEYDSSIVQLIINGT